MKRAILLLMPFLFVGCGNKQQTAGIQANTEMTCLSHFGRMFKETVQLNQTASKSKTIEKYTYISAEEDAKLNSIFTDHLAKQKEILKPGPLEDLYPKRPSKEKVQAKNSNDKKTVARIKKELPKRWNSCMQQFAKYTKECSKYSANKLAQVDCLKFHNEKVYVRLVRDMEIFKRFNDTSIKKMQASFVRTFDQHIQNKRALRRFQVMQKMKARRAAQGKMNASKVSKGVNKAKSGATKATATKKTTKKTK